MKPCLAFQPAAEAQAGKGIVGKTKIRAAGFLVGRQFPRDFFYILRPRFHDDGGVGPSGVALGGAHSVYDNFFRAARRRNDKAAGAHAKRVNAAPVDLRGQAVFCGAKTGGLALSVELDFVYQLARVLHARSDGERLRFQRFGACARYNFVNVRRGMSRGQNHRVGKEFFLRAVRRPRHNAANDFCAGSVRKPKSGVVSKPKSGGAASFAFGLSFVRSVNNKIHDAAFKVELSAQLQNFLAHVVDDLRKLVRSDVRMRVGQDFWVGAKVNEGLQNLADVSALVAARVKLSVTKSSGPAFAKTVVAVRVNDSLYAYGRDVALSLVGWPSALDDDWLNAALQKF